jgi:tetratricopeptide (TPR) repeat protein
MIFRAANISFMVCLLHVSAASGQAASEHLLRGDSAHANMDPAAALEHFRAAHLADRHNYEAYWKFARSQVDVAKLLMGDSVEHKRDSLYGVAVAMALDAVYLDSLDAEGHAILASALGRLSRTKGGRERVRYGREIYEHAARAIELNPDHDGAHHVIGAWHAEVRRLSGITRFFAKTFMGGGFMDKASRDSAVAHLVGATEIKPDYVFHHLELAEVLIDLERYDEARRELQIVLELPITDVSDPMHKETATSLLEEIRGRL